MSQKLLLADDSLTIQKVVELVLAPENFEIMTFNDGEQALQALESFGPDIVLADIEMPKLNGYQLCEKIKNDMATGHIPVILLAGAFEPFDEEYAKAVYADDYIIKPFESQELISKVKALLSAAPPKGTSEETLSIEAPEQEAIQPEGIGGFMEQGEAASPAEEPVWAVETAPDEERAGEHEIPDDEYGAKIALTEAVRFEDELAEAMKEEPEVRVPEMTEPMMELAGAPSGEDVSQILMRGLDEKEISFAIKASVEKVMSELAPGIIGDVTRELVKDLLGSLRGEVDEAIRRIVPEVAEAVIRKEIEKITSEMK